MTKWIRWSGLAGFIIVLGLIGAFWLLALGPLMKMAVEKYGSDAIGAQVNVADISLGFTPLSLTITGVQVADKDAPMENLVSFDSAVATVDSLPLFLGKIIIPDVQLTGVAIGTLRSQSGALVIETQEQSADDDNAELEKQSTENAELANNTLPSVDDIFEREALLTEKYGQAFQSAYKQSKKDIDDALMNLPTESALKDYETELNKILKGKFKNVDDFKQRKKDFDALKAQFKKDKQAIADLKLAVKNSKTDLKQKWTQLEGAPKQDLASLKGKYTLDGAGVSNLAALLFGDEAGGYAETAFDFYQKIQPLLVDDGSKAELQALKDQRLEGRFVHFATDRPMPDVWVKTLSFSMALPEFPKDTSSLGQIAVQVLDITHQQDVIDAPTRMLATGKNLKDMKSLQLNGVFDHRTSPGKDSFKFNIEGWQLNKLQLGLVGLELVSSNTDVTANAEFSSNQLTFEGQGQFNQSKFDSEDRTFVAKEMVAALKNVDQFSVTASANGEITSPSVSLKSDLDNQLNKAFDKRIEQKQVELEDKLKDKLNDKLLSYSGSYAEQLKELDLTQGSLEEKSKALEQLAKAKLSSYEDQVKAELDAKKAKEKAKLDAKIAKEKAKLDAKIAKEKAEADKKKKELEEKAKAKLKKIFG